MFASLPLPQPDAPTRIKLPMSGPRRYGLTYLRLVTAVRPSPWGAAFEGAVFKPGSMVHREELGDRPVLLEAAGPIGTGRRREQLYILWKWDDQRLEWMELGRASSYNSDWTVALRPLAASALADGPRLVEVSAEAERIAAKVCDVLDTELASAVEGVRRKSLGMLYDRVLARLAS